MMPLCVDWPKVACAPVMDPNSPTRMSAPPLAPVLVPPPSFGGQPRSPNDNTASETKMIAFFRIALLFKEWRIVHDGVGAEDGCRRRAAYLFHSRRTISHTITMIAHQT